jgi:hypothetical protein
MRARSVNERQEFQRGREPKTSLDIGGINLSEEYDERLLELKMNLANQKKLADEEWREYLETVFVGKTITAHMTQIRSFPPSGKPSDAKMERGDLTISVSSVHFGQNFAEVVDNEYDTIPRIMVADTENKVYSVPLNQKIRIS